MAENIETNLDIAQGIRTGDRSVFERLFRAYYSPLTAYARFILKNEFLAEEIVQEVFLKLWENHASIFIGTSVKAYLYKSVHNQCINYFKSSKVNTRLSEEAIKEMVYHADLALKNFTQESLDMLIQHELEDNIKTAIEKLPTQCREIFLLNREEDLSYPQIASKLGISVNTVKTQIMRALERLREAYKKI